MTLIERYINAVAQYLPTARRGEITRELHANILDRLEHLSEQQGRDLNTTEIAEVIKDIGHPREVARRFLPRQLLVSEELFPLFKEALYYSLVVAWVFYLVQKGIVFLSAGYFSVSELLFGFSDTALFIFALITGIFYVLSNPPGNKPLFTLYESWKPEDLSALDSRWQSVSFGEQAGELALNVFLLLILHYPLWAAADVLANLRIAFAASTVTWIPTMTVLIIASILLNLWNFRFRFWSRPKLIINGVINLSSAFVLFILSNKPEIYTVISGAELSVGGIGDFNQISKIGAFFAGLWLLYEAARDFYRARLLAPASPG
jgi:hypothetical protein